MSVLDSLPVLGTIVFVPNVGHAAGRVVLSGARYSRLKRSKLKKQSGECSRCPRPLADPREAALHHPHGRGMGGGKRDDRDSELVCHDCHQVAKIERRESWLPQPFPDVDVIEAAAPVKVDPQLDLFGGAL